MVQKSCGDMISGVLRVGKYRYVLIAALLFNVLLVTHFFGGSTISNLNPFRGDAPVAVGSEGDYLPPPDHSTGKEAPAKADKPKARPAPYKPFEPLDVADLGPPTSPALLDLHTYDFNGPYVGWPLARVCKETVKQPGLVFVCDNNSGGIGNIRNFILTCIRYAIDAGATGIIMPRIQRRSEEDLANIFTTGFQPFDYFFDEEHFRWAMGEYCPSVMIYNNVSDIPHADKVREIKEFLPKELNMDLDGCDGRGVNRHLDQFRPKFDAWLKKMDRTLKAEAPVTIRFKWATFFEWPIYRDGPEFATTFGDLLHIRRDIQSLAAKVLMEMSNFVGLHPDPDLIEMEYLGVHLRTESDALEFWPNFQQQSEGYMKEAESRSLKHAYLACGNITDGQRFSEQAFKKIKLNVTTKDQLLKGEDLATLKAFSWDQQALVDFLVLQKSTHFTGCSFSSFTMNIAFRRHLMTDGIHTRMWKSPADEFSSLVGRFESWYGDWMFMYECMWP